MKRIFLIALALILALPVCVFAAEDGEMLGYFTTPATETGTRFPGVPQWDDVAASEESASLFAALILADLETGCALNGYESPSSYDKVYLWTLDGTVYITIYGDISFSGFIMPSGELMVLIAVNTEVSDAAAEYVAMQLESGQMEEAIHITSEMYERGTLMALTGEPVTDESGAPAASGSTYVPDNSQGQGVGVFTKAYDSVAEMFPGAVSWSEATASEESIARLAQLTIEDLLAGCEENGIAPPEEYDRVFLWVSENAVYFTVYSQQSYAVIYGDGQMIVAVAINESVASHAHEHMAYMVESGQTDDYIHVTPAMLSGEEPAQAPEDVPAEESAVSSGSPLLPKEYTRLTCANLAVKEAFSSVRWSKVAGDAAAADAMARAILSDAAGLSDFGFDPETVDYAVLLGVQNFPVLYVSMGGGMWMLMARHTDIMAVWTPSHPAALGDPEVFAAGEAEDGVYYILTEDGVAGGEAQAQEAAQASLPAEDTEYSIPATVTLRNMPYRTGWEDIAEDPDKLCLMAASILEDADEGLSEYGFDSAQADYFILFDMIDFPMLYVSLDGGVWSFLPGHQMITAHWMPGHNATGADPYDFAEWSIEIGSFDDYAVLTADDIERGHELAAGNAALRDGDDWVAKFRMADKVYNYNSGYAPFVYQQQAAFISPTGEVLLAGEIDGARVFDDNGYAPVYTGPYSAGIAYGGMWGLADTEGNIVLPMEYSAIERTDDGLYSVPLEDGRGFFDPETGEFYSVTGYSEVAWQCSNGLVPVAYATVNEYGEETGKNWGYANLQGELVIGLDWESVSYTWEYGYAYVQQGGKYGVIDSAGNLVISCEWDGCAGIGENFVIMKRTLPAEETDGLTQKPEYELKEFVVFDIEQGLELSRFVAYTVDIQKVPGYIAVYMSFDNEGGLYTVTGEEILPMEYYDIYMYSETHVLLAQKDAEGESSHGVYDLESGVWLSEMQWDNRVLPRGGFYRVEKDGLFGYLNESFELVIPPQYEEASDFSDGYALVRENGEWKFIDTAGQQVF